MLFLSGLGIEHGVDLPQLLGLSRRVCRHLHRHTSARSGLAVEAVMKSGPGGLRKVLGLPSEPIQATRAGPAAEPLPKGILITTV